MISKEIAFPPVFARFKARARKEQLWYFDELLKVSARNPPNRIVNDLERVVQELPTQKRQQCLILQETIPQPRVPIVPSPWFLAPLLLRAGPQRAGPCSLGWLAPGTSNAAVRDMPTLQPTSWLLHPGIRAPFASVPSRADRRSSLSHLDCRRTAPAELHRVRRRHNSAHPHHGNLHGPRRFPNQAQRDGLTPAPTALSVTCSAAALRSSASIAMAKNVFATLTAIGSAIRGHARHVGDRCHVGVSFTISGRLAAVFARPTRYSTRPASARTPSRRVHVRAGHVQLVRGDPLRVVQPLDHPHVLAHRVPKTSR